MKIHHLRNATLVIESAAMRILVDPMLSDKGQLPPFAFFRHPVRRNPLVPLPANTGKILSTVTHCLITHSQTFGIRALQHTDHLDRAGEIFLNERNTPVIARVEDGAYLRKLGLNVLRTLTNWQPEQMFGGEIVAVPARHGHGWVHRLMANGAGFYLKLPAEPSIYISGDTVFTQDVARALTELKPDIAVMAAGSACLDVGGPILMPLDELLAFARTAPGCVVANHLEALNHCPTTRSQLKEQLAQAGLLAKVIIPEDGETIVF